jgi:hypothetical protein
VWSAIALCGYATTITAQRRAPGQAQANQGIQVALNAGGTTYQSSEAGKCTHAPVASIYNTVSEMWSVQQNSQGRSLALTLWKPKDGSGDMVTLSLTNGNVSHQVNTVRGGGATAGSGKVTMRKAVKARRLPARSRATRSPRTWPRVAKRRSFRDISPAWRFGRP